MAVSVMDKFDVPARTSPLNGIPAAGAIRRCSARKPGFAPQKKIERISPQSAVRTVAGRGIARIGAN